MDDSDWQAGSAPQYFNYSQAIHGSSMYDGMRDGAPVSTGTRCERAFEAPVPTTHTTQFPIPLATIMNPVHESVYYRGPNLEDNNMERIVTLQSPNSASVEKQPMVPSRLLTMANFEDPAVIKTCLAFLNTHALLVKIAHENFELYRQGKGKFYDIVRCKFWVATKERYDVNVKGYMERWEKNRREELRLEQRLSGKARANGEWEVALDLWIAAVDDYERDKKKEKEEKNEMSQVLLEEKEKIDLVRTDMIKTLGKKRAYDVISSDGEEEEWEGGEGENQAAPAVKRAKTVGSFTRVPAGNSRRSTTAQFQKSMKEGDESFIEAMKEMESTRLTRMEEIFKTAFSSDTGKENSIALEKRVESMENKMDQILGLLLRKDKSD